VNLPVIVVTLYRRPDATRRLLAALSECYGVNECDVYLSCDIAPEYGACYEVARIATDWADQRNRRFGGVKDVTAWVNENNPRLGIDLHKISAITKAFARTGASSVVLLEDDTGLSRDALNYFATTLEATENDPEILAVCGFNRYPMDNQGDEDPEAARRAIETDLYGTFRHDQFKAWGWAMHRATWERFYGDGGARYASEVDRPNGRFDWWMTLSLCRDAGMRCILPRVARTNHAEWRDAEHTAKEYYERQERATVGAWSVPDLPDTGLLGWGK
jgi:hypothetical protein